MKDYQRQWHSVFAWFPVWAGNDQVWLKKVERRFRGFRPTEPKWEYRTLAEAAKAGPLVAYPAE